MNFQSIFNKIKKAHEYSVKVLNYINDFMINDENSEDHTSVYNDEKTRENENSNNFESEYIDESENLENKSNEDEDVNNQIINYGIKEEIYEQLSQNESENQNSYINLDDLKKLIKKLKNDVLSIVSLNDDIINVCQKSIKLQNHPLIRRSIKLLPYISNWIFGALTTTLKEKLPIKSQYLRSFLSSAIGALLNGGTSCISLMFVRSTIWEAVKESLMWCGSFLAEQIGDIMISILWKYNSYSCTHGIVSDTVCNIIEANIGDSKINITDFSNICSENSSNDIINITIDSSTKLILKTCFSTGLNIVWVSKLFAIAFFIILVFVIKYISYRIRKRNKNTDDDSL